MLDQFELHLQSDFVLVLKKQKFEKIVSVT